jgi:sugar/nucleoside kinase (ribokinase family)
MYDIFGIGCATADDFIRVDQFPKCDTKQEIAGEARQGGGLIPTALVAASRMGAHCGYFDILGDDELSRWVVSDLEREGLDTSYIVTRQNARPIHATIIVTADGSRTILYSTEGRIMQDEDVPSFEQLPPMKALLLDDVNSGAMEGLARTAAGARRTGIPVIADFERPPYPPLLDQIDHLIISRNWATAVTGSPSPREALQALWNSERSVVIVTCGSEGAWYMEPGEEPQHQPAFPVDAVDTTGCGDVFHGVYAALLVQQVSLAERVRWASAAAALKATKLGGRPGIPNRTHVEAFLRAHYLS